MQSRYETITFPPHLLHIIHFTALQSLILCHPVHPLINRTHPKHKGKGASLISLSHSGTQHCCLRMWDQVQVGVITNLMFCNVGVQIGVCIPTLLLTGVLNTSKLNMWKPIIHWVSWSLNEKKQHCCRVDLVKSWAPSTFFPSFPFTK